MARMKLFGEAPVFLLIKNRFKNRSSNLGFNGFSGQHALAVI